MFIPFFQSPFWLFASTFKMVLWYEMDFLKVVLQFEAIKVQIVQFGFNIVNKS